MSMSPQFLKGSEVRDGRLPYVSPCVLSEQEILLETNLLGGSISYSSWVEIAGQGMQGLYFEQGDIVTDSNYWGE